MTDEEYYENFYNKCRDIYDELVTIERKAFYNDFKDENISWIKPKDTTLMPETTPELMELRTNLENIESEIKQLARKVKKKSKYKEELEILKEDLEILLEKKIQLSYLKQKSRSNELKEDDLKNKVKSLKNTIEKKKKNKKTIMESINKEEINYNWVVIAKYNNLIDEKDLQDFKSKYKEFFNFLIELDSEDEKRTINYKDKNKDNYEYNYMEPLFSYENWYIHGKKYTKRLIDFFEKEKEGIEDPLTFLRLNLTPAGKTIKQKLPVLPKLYAEINQKEYPSSHLLKKIFNKESIYDYEGRYEYFYGIFWKYIYQQYEKYCYEFNGSDLKQEELSKIKKKSTKVPRNTNIKYNKKQFQMFESDFINYKGYGWKNDKKKVEKYIGKDVKDFNDLLCEIFLDLLPNNENDSSRVKLDKFCEDNDIIIKKENNFEFKDGCYKRIQRIKEKNEKDFSLIPYFIKIGLDKFVFFDTVEKVLKIYGKTLDDIKIKYCVKKNPFFSSIYENKKTNNNDDNHDPDNPSNKDEEDEDDDDTKESVSNDNIDGYIASLYKQFNSKVNKYIDEEGKKDNFFYLLITKLKKENQQNSADICDTIDYYIRKLNKDNDYLRCQKCTCKTRKQTKIKEENLLCKMCMDSCKEKIVILENQKEDPHIQIQKMIVVLFFLHFYFENDVEAKKIKENLVRLLIDKSFRLLFMDFVGIIDSPHRTGDFRNCRQFKIGEFKEKLNKEYPDNEFSCEARNDNAFEWLNNTLKKFFECFFKNIDVSLYRMINDFLTYNTERDSGFYKFCRMLGNSIGMKENNQN